MIIDFVKEILTGKIFIYPTDTIYGIGCNALNKDSVAKIRSLKQRIAKPFSVIAPNKEWIRRNCKVNEEGEKWLLKLPGPYTLILERRIKNCVAKETNSLEDEIGVRIPDHWFTELIAKTGIPFVTTSVNLSGEPYMTSLEGLDETIKNNVDFIIYEGEIEGKESMKIDLTK